MVIDSSVDVFLMYMVTFSCVRRPLMINVVSSGDASSRPVLRIVLMIRGVGVFIFKCVHCYLVVGQLANFTHKVHYRLKVSVTSSNYNITCFDCPSMCTT